MPLMETREIQTLEELDDIAGDILNRKVSPNRAHVLALSGDLGAGKTAFVKRLAKQLAIHEEITSPTFVVMKSYEIPSHAQFKTLTHIDAYRIESKDEMRVLGFEALCADPSQLIAVEWPERIPSCMPEDASPIGITLEGNMRSVTF